jgi:hypothetical protein
MNKHKKRSSSILDEMFDAQNEFSNLFFDKSELTIEEKEELTKSFTLALHSEASGLIDSVNFKDHRLSRKEIDKSKLLYKSVDSFRYILAIMNLWDFSPCDFIEAFKSKDLFLDMRHTFDENPWQEGQPVVLFDVDDVLNEFRDTFTQWLHDEHGVYVDPDSTEYYSSKEVKAAGLSPEGTFQQFIAEGGLMTIAPNQKMINIANKLYEKGVFIQLITARPIDKLKCKYDTYAWIKAAGIKCNHIDFSPEKFRWLLMQDYYHSDVVLCAVDDSSKHASEYAKHGIDVLSPRASYNKELENVDGIFVYDKPAQAYNKILKKLEEFNSNE